MPVNERRPVRKPIGQQNLFVPTQAVEPPSATAEELRGLLEENYRRSGGGQVLLQPPPGSQGELVGEGRGIFDPAPTQGPADSTFAAMMREAQQSGQNDPLSTRAPPTPPRYIPGGRGGVYRSTTPQTPPERPYTPPPRTSNLPQMFPAEIPNPFPPTASEQQTLQMFEEIQRRLEGLPGLGAARELEPPPPSTPDPGVAIREEVARERARQTQNLADKEVLASEGDNPDNWSFWDRFGRVADAFGHDRPTADLEENAAREFRERRLRLRTAPFEAQDRAGEARAATASEGHRAETQTAERGWETIARNILDQNDRDVQRAEIGSRNAGAQIEGLTNLAELRARVAESQRQRQQQAAAALAGSTDQAASRAGIAALLPEGLEGGARVALGREAETSQIMEGLRAHIAGTNLENEGSRVALNMLLREFNPNLPSSANWLKGLTPDQVYNQAAIGAGAEGAARAHPELRGRGRYLFQPPPSE